MIKVGIIGAMEQEVIHLRAQIKECKIQPLRGSLKGIEIYTGELQGVNVALLKSGIGKVSAAMGTTLLLDYCQPDYVINTGSAGGLSKDLNIGDIVISQEVLYHDVCVTAFGYAKGQMAGCPARFKANEKLIKMAEKCLQQLKLSVAETCPEPLNPSAVTGLICSGDAFINGGKPLNNILTTFPDAIAVDMEAAAIGHICHQYGIPFVVVRAISDVACQESHLNFEEFLDTAAIQSSALVEAMLIQLSQDLC